MKSVEKSESAAPVQVPRRPSRLRRNLLIAVGALLLFTVTGFFLLPPLLKSQLEKRASAILGRKVTVGKVRLNPYALSLTLENLDVRLKEGDGSFVGWNRLYVNFDALASLHGEWVLSEIELEGFHAAAIVKPNGTLNFADVLETVLTPSGNGSTTGAAKAARPIRIGSLKVSEARLEFADQSRKKPFATVVGPVTFAVTEFRTAGAKGAPYHLEAVSEAGEKFAWTGSIAAEPFGTTGEFSLENIILSKYAAYYSEMTQADLVEGKLSLRGKYEVGLGAGQPVLKLTDGALQLSGIKVLERASQEAVVELASLDLAGVNVDAEAMKVGASSVILAGGRIKARRETNGAINLLAMLQAPAGVARGTNTVAAAASKEPDINVGEVALKDFKMDFTDLAGVRPAQLGLSGVQVSLKDVTLRNGASMPLEVSLAWAPKGTVHVGGSVSIRPEVKADLKLETVGVEILPLSPYVEEFINARITQGAVTATLAAQLSLPANQPPVVTAAGDVRVEKFGLLEAAHNEELAGFSSLALTGLKAGTSPQLSLTLDEVDLAGPFARVVMNADKTLNLASLMVAKSGGETNVAARPAGPAPKFSIGKVVVSEGVFSFADRSIEPNVGMAVDHFTGTVAGLSSENLAKADVELKATVDGAGPIAIAGKLDPLGAKKFVDLKIDFRNVDLVPLSPYSGKFAGYELARGKLVVDTKFLLDDKKINSATVITLNQFTFGAPVKSPDATGLPVRLGVALLKDLDGKIVIDIPIEGSTDDPNFRIGKVVLRVVVNLLTKAAVSPFALLGSMFGGGGEELGYQDFAPGLAGLRGEEVKKLETMVKALTQRPGLSLDLDGSYDKAADTYVLKQVKLAAAVRRAIWEAKHDADPNIAPPGQLVIAAEENAAMVKKMFDVKFPPGTQFGAPLPKAPVVVAPPPVPVVKKGLFWRTLDYGMFWRKHGEVPKAAEPVQAVEVKPEEATPVAGPAVGEMTGRLAEAVEVSDADLRELASARAQQVRDYFVNTGKINPERLFLAKETADAAKAGRGPRVFLQLQ